MSIDIKKIKKAEKEGRLLDYDELFANYSKKYQEAVKKKAKYIMASMEIIKLRREKRLTQSQLAKKINVKREYISRIESGEQNVTLETLIKIASAVGKEFKFRFE